MFSKLVEFLQNYIYKSNTHSKGLKEFLHKANIETFFELMDTLK